MEAGRRVWVQKPDMAADNGVHFPEVGRRFSAAGSVRAGRVGQADSLLFSTRALVDFAESYFREVLQGE